MDPWYPPMDLFFCLKGGQMSRLQSLEQIENINNLNHRAVLKALRDTTYSIAEIAARLGINRTSIYYIAKAYLPTGYLNKRKQMLQLEKMSKAPEDRYTPEDIVNVVPDINTKRSNSVQNQTAISEPLTVEQPQTSLSESNNFDRSQNFSKERQTKVESIQIEQEKKTTVLKDKSIVQLTGSNSFHSIRNRLPFEYGDFKFSWEGEFNSQQMKCICDIIKTVLVKKL